VSANVGQPVLAAVGDLLPVLRERAQETEDARDVPAETVKALAEAGFFRLLQPARYGGLEADPMTFYTAVRTIAGECGSTGWVASAVGVHPWQLALFPAAAQEEVWGADTNTRMSSSYAPTGRARLAEGGHRLSGRWSFSSGCNHASWVLLGGIVTNDEGAPVDFRTFLLPASDYAIEDVWDTVGLRGTGSNDIVVAGAFVPEHRSLSFADVTTCVCPGQEVNQARCTGYRSARCSPARSPRPSSAWRPARTRRTWPTSGPGSAPPTPATRWPRTRSPRRGSRRRPRRSTRPGSRSSAT
jgi:3-hydroxy-9,10-secoandrosta-1,3,5(10)-triene-9,17-dione monooxygenase